MDLTSTIDTAATQDSAATGRRLRWGPWATLAWGLPIALILILSQTAGAIVFLKWWQFAHPEQPLGIDKLTSHGGVLAFSLAVSTPILLAALAFVIRLSRVRFAEYLALKLPSWRDVGVGIGGLTAVLALTGLLANLTGQETPEFMTDTYASARDAGMLPLLLLSFVFLGPLQEELLFRGFLFRGFALSFGVWPTVLLTALGWALLHVQYQWFFVGEILALGIVLGWLRARSGSTILTFGLHATVNGIALVQMAAMSGS